MKERILIVGRTQEIDSTVKGSINSSSTAMYLEIPFFSFLFLAISGYY